MLRRAALSLILTACGPELFTDVDPANLALQRPGAFVVFGWLGEGEARRPLSVFLDEEGRELSREPALVIRTAAGDLLWRDEEVATPTQPCMAFCDEDGCHGSNEHGPGIDVRAVLAPRAGAPVPVVEPMPIEPPGIDVFYPREHRRTVELEGAVGPFLFLREQTYEDACGVHGLGSVRRKVFSLEERRVIELAPDAQDLEHARSSAPGLFDAEAAEHAADDGAIGGDEGTPEPSEVTLTGLIPRLGRDGLSLSYQLSAEACYACSRGDADDYTRSIRVLARRLPAALAPHAEVPPAVLRFLAAHPELRAGGFSGSEGR